MALPALSASCGNLHIAQCSLSTRGDSWRTSVAASSIALPSSFFGNMSQQEQLRQVPQSRPTAGSTRAAAVVRAAAAPEYVEGELDAPRWTGGGPLSNVVNLIISVKPLYALLKLGARQVLINTAEKNGVAWRQWAEELRQSQELKAEKERLENQAVEYPSYYLQPFHAYDDGNLCWEAAYEAEPATLSMCKRAIPWADTVEEAARVLREGWLAAIRSHHEVHSNGLPLDSILDIGCSVGVSTRWLQTTWPEAEITGLDLSPFFLAVASLREKQQAAKASGSSKQLPAVQWLHAKGEATGLPSQSFALVSFAFVFHECPTAAIRDLLREAKRLLKAGGTVAITDNSPKSKVIQNLPPAVFTLMKSTEPWSDQYYLTDIEAIMKEEGFSHVCTVLSDPRHRTITATA